MLNVFASNFGRELVRMKAACCVLRYIRITPSYQRHLQDASKKLLYDKDPGVMSIGVKIQLELLRVSVHVNRSQSTAGIIPSKISL
jgi:hypothetical protein